MNLLRRLAQRSVAWLTRVAAILALVGMAIMAYSILSPRPLPVILAMSVGHVFGALAVLFYALAVVLDASRKTMSADVAAPPAERPSEAGSEEG